HSCFGKDAVFHVAALAGYWGPWDAYYGPNVVGTENVLSGCRRAGVRKLIYTSTPSVVAARGHLEHVDERVPYPEKFECPYPATKALAEQLVLKANGVDGLLTVSVRPHLIFGPGDPHLLPRIIERGRNGQLIQVGNGANKVDVVYVENAADAHLLAADRLGRAPIDGQAYFISQGAPLVLWAWLNMILERLHRSGVPGESPAGGLRSRVVRDPLHGQGACGRLDLRSPQVSDEEGGPARHQGRLHLDLLLPGSGGGREARRPGPRQEQDRGLSGRHRAWQRRDRKRDL